MYIDRKQKTYRKRCNCKIVTLLLQTSCIKKHYSVISYWPKLILHLRCRFKSSRDTYLLCKYADDTTSLVPEVCDVKIEDKLDNIIRWSSANKLQLNLGKSKEIVIRRLSVHLHILPVQLDSTERLECIKLLVFLQTRSCHFVSTLNI